MTIFIIFVSSHENEIIQFYYFLRIYNFFYIEHFPASIFKLLSLLILRCSTRKKIQIKISSTYQKIVLFKVFKTNKVNEIKKDL